MRDGGLREESNTEQRADNEEKKDEGRERKERRKNEGEVKYGE